MIAGKVFGRAIVGPCIALAASISVTGLGVSSLTRSGLWEPHSPGGRFAVILSPSMQRNPLDLGRRPGSPLELCFFHLHSPAAGRTPRSAALPKAVLDWSLGLEVAVVPPC